MNAKTVISDTPSTPEGVASALEAASAHERIQWGLEHFGERIFLSTSFGVQSAVMLHLVSEVAPGLPVVFIDTGYHFPETYRFAEELSRRLAVNLKVYQAARSAAFQEAVHGKLWEQGVSGIDQYNMMNKVEPMDRAVKELGAEAWFSGLRRTQASTREALPVVEKQNRIWKIYPIIDWNDRDVYRYLEQNGLAYHPLWDKGYVSVGDWHSSRPLGDGMSAEETRFGGLKRECGLHEKTERVDFQI